MARTGQHPWLHPGWKTLPTRIGYCSNTNCDRRFRCEDDNVAFTHLRPHYYRVRQVEPCHQLDEVARRSSLGAMPKQQQQQHTLAFYTKRVMPVGPIMVGKVVHPVQSHGYCPVRATGGSLPCGRYLLAPLTGY